MICKTEQTYHLNCFNAYKVNTTGAAKIEAYVETLGFLSTT